MKYKKNIVVISIVLVILITLIIVLSIIWKGNSRTHSEISSSKNQVDNTKISASNISKYTSKSYQDIEQRNISDYVEEVRSMLYNKEYNKLFAKLDDEFKEKNNLSEYNIKDYMEKNKLVGEEINVIDCSNFKEKNNVYVYRLKYSIGKDIKYVNIIESSPYNYTISFEQDTVPTLINRNTKCNVENLEFDISEYKKKEDSIIYKIKVTNKGNEKVKFDFTSINSVEVIMEDGGSVKQPSSILESDIDYSLNNNSYFIKSFYFPINMQFHKDIVGIKFYNVYIGKNLKNIYIKL